MEGMLKEKNGTWKFGNQISTYELIIRQSRKHTNLDKASKDRWVTEKYNIVKQNPNKYGTYAGLNDWSPTFTNAQLAAFNDLCQNT